MSISERVTFIEIDVPVCQLTYGEAPCTAELGVTGDIKCYNSRKTCQDIPNLDEAKEVLRLAVPTSYLPLGITAIANVSGVSYTPSRIKLAESIGVRATLSITCQDHPFPDTGVGGDKYRNTRGFDPNEVGTFWGKIKARFPYLRGATLRWIQGNPEQNLDQMERRTFAIDRIEGPDTNGQVRIVAKDPLTVVDDQRAQAPALSRGLLDSPISAGSGSLTLTPAGVGDDYPSSGKVAIGGSEIVSYTRSGDVLTLTGRGLNNTTAQAHDQNDRVQLVLEYFGQSPAAIINDLLVNYASIPTDYINLTNWAEEINEFLGTLYTATIAEPTPVRQLINEILVQASISIWWDELGETIRLQVLRDIVKQPFVYNEDFILGDTFNQADQPDKRVSRAQIYYGQINPLDGQDDPSNYRNSLLNVSLESEINHGSPAIRQIFSRWIPAVARPAADRVTKIILSRFAEPPKLYSFGLLRETVPFLPQLGGGVFVDSRFNQDEQGKAITAECQIVQVGVSDAVLTYQAEEVVISEEVEPLDPTVKVVAVDSDVINFNLRTAFQSAYVEAQPGDTVICEIRGGVIVGSESTSLPAFRTGTGWPAGIEPIILIEPNARIIGRGGVGGAANAFRSGALDFSRSTVGGNGGPALLVETEVSIENQGIIGGGGGGGGGAASSSRVTRALAEDALVATASGGGGGQGFVNSIGGSAVASAAGGRTETQARSGTAGTQNSAGVGRRASANRATRDIFGTSTARSTARGGNGGGLGSTGGTGSGSGDAVRTSGGGQSGAAVQGDSLVTWVAEGTILGSRVG